MLKGEHDLYRLQIGGFNVADYLLLLGLVVVEDCKQVALDELGHKVVYQHQDLGHTKYIRTLCSTKYQPPYLYRHGLPGSR